MRVEVTDRARAVVEQARQVRSGTLTITIGTGCCESTAPFLYEDFWPGPDQAAIGDVDGVTVYAPAYLRALYPEDESVRLDVVDELAESLSIETEFGCRLVLRGSRSDSSAEPDACDVEATPVSATVEPSRVVGALPEALRGLRIR